MSFIINFFNFFKSKKNNDEQNIAIHSAPSRDIDKYFKDRLERKINIYDKLAKRNKYLFWIMTSISMICAALVPALINLNCTIPATILSLIVTIMVGLQGIFHPREHWRNYDRISATLRREEMLFSTKSGVYEDIKEDTKMLVLLVSRVEDFIAREREDTIIMRTSEQELSVNVIKTKGSV